MGKEKTIKEEMSDQITTITIEYGNGKLHYTASRPMSPVVLKSIFDSCSDIVLKDLIKSEVMESVRPYLKDPQVLPPKKVILHS